MSGYLREMIESDLPMVLEWRNREEVRNNMYTSHVISDAEHLAWWSRETVNPKTRLLVFALENHQPAGVVTFTHYTGEQGVASWAFYSGDIGTRGLGQMMEIAALTYAFEVLKLRKLVCEVLSFNKRVADFHRKNGFKIEGVFRQAYEREGNLHDIYALAMFSEDWFRSVKQALQKIRSGSLAGKAYEKTFVFTPDAINAFAAVTGDNNPVHLDRAAARAAGFDDRIAHGMLSAGFISAVFATEFPGPGSIYLSQDLSFVKPILAGSSARLALKVIAHVGRRVEIETRVLVGDDVCIAGEAVLLIPRQSEESPA